MTLLIEYDQSTVGALFTWQGQVFTPDQLIQHSQSVGEEERESIAKAIASKFAELDLEVAKHEKVRDDIGHVLFDLLSSTNNDNATTGDTIQDSQDMQAMRLRDEAASVETLREPDEAGDKSDTSDSDDGFEPTSRIHEDFDLVGCGWDAISIDALMAPKERSPDRRITRLLDDQYNQLPPQQPIRHATVRVPPITAAPPIEPNPTGIVQNLDPDSNQVVSDYTSPLTSFEARRLISSEGLGASFQFRPVSIDDGPYTARPAGLFEPRRNVFSASQTQPAVTSTQPVATQTDVSQTTQTQPVATQKDAVQAIQSPSTATKKKTGETTKSGSDLEHVHAKIEETEDA